MKDQGCEQRFYSVAYPKHARKPEDLLNFIESDEFQLRWDSIGLDCENDATSLQLCIMASPKGNPMIQGSGGIRRHIHSFRECGIAKEPIAVYYAYYEEYGIAYLICIDETASECEFSDEQLGSFRAAIDRMRAALEQRSILN